jgi:CHAT domain-containing protein
MRIHSILQFSKKLGKKLKTRSRFRFLLGCLLGVGVALTLAIALPTLPSGATLDLPVPMSTDRSALSAQQLTLQGQQQWEAGDAQAAWVTWQQAEARYRQQGNATGILGSQLNQAKALQTLGFYRRAKALLESMVTSQRSHPASRLKANTWLTLGNLLRLMSDYPASQTLLNESLSLAQQLQSPSDIQAAYLHLGNTYLAQQQPDRALDAFRQAAAIVGDLQLSAQLHQLKLLHQLDRSAETATLLSQVQAHLQTLPHSQTRIYGQIELATLPALSHLQAAQLLVDAAQQAKQLGNPRAESYAIGRLAGLYEQSQQWPEAVKLTDQALRLAKGVNVPEILYQWQWQMGRILRSQGQRSAATIAYTEAFQTLQSLRGELSVISQDAQFSFRDQVEPVYRELVDLLLQPTATQANLQQARQVIESLQLAELNNFFREPCVETTGTPIDQLDPHAAVLYPVILRDRLEVILSLPGQPLRHYATPVPQAEFERSVEKMQASLRSTSFPQERMAAASTLYRWLIQPATPDLAQQRIQTLVFVLDGSLRNIPIAALSDGQQYLIEQYQIALAPSLRLVSSRQATSNAMLALVGGLSEGTAGAIPLPGVQQEVEQIRQRIAAQVVLNRSFTTQTLQTQIQDKPFTVVHLATHGQFSSNAEETYIQTWDGRLTVNHLQTLLNQRSLTVPTAIDLLVLSACQTAEGDQRAALGMAGMAVRSGARSTLATLWMVNDASTATFMTHFYKALLQPGTTKAAAARTAQLALIQTPEFQHPFYWAPFILVGNWL